MTLPYGPARALSGTEIDNLWVAVNELRRTVETALDLLAKTLHQRLTDEVAAWGDVPERVARLEDLLDPLTVDPADPEVEWAYRRGDGILRPAPADPEERLEMIAAGVKLFPVVHRVREDGRIEVVPPPKLADVPGPAARRAAGILIDRAEKMP